MAPERATGIARTAASAYVVVVLLITWLPGDQAGQVTGIVALVAEWVDPLVPFAIGYVVLEFLANIALFVPLGVLVALGWRRLPWWGVTVLGFTLSAVIEIVQLWLPTRFPTLSDVVANTLGALIGALLAKAFPRVFAARRSSLGS